MTARGSFRGHEVFFDGSEFRYSDTDEPTVGNPRPCGLCKRPDTPEGHDPCLGTLTGVMNACCGHGNPSEAYVQFPDRTRLAGDEALAFMRQHGKGPP